MNLKKKLKEALKKAGLKEGLADHIKIESEDQIEGIVSDLQSTLESEEEEELDFKKLLSSKEFSEYVEKEGFDQVVEGSKTLKSQFDRKVTKGIKTFKSKFMKTSDNEEDDEDDEEGEGTQSKKSGEQMPKWAKDLADKVDKLNKKEESDEWSEQVSNALKKSKIPEKYQTKWASRIVKSDDKKLEDQIKALEEEYDDIEKDFGGTFKGLPTGGKVDSKSASKEEVDELVDDLF